MHWHGELEGVLQYEEAGESELETQKEVDETTGSDEWYGHLVFEVEPRLFRRCTLSQRNFSYSAIYCVPEAPPYA